MLTDKVAIVTGGTRGIGYATVKKFLKEGAKVVLFGSNDISVSKALNNLISDDPTYDVMGMNPDITNPKSIQIAIGEIIDKYGHIDILVNNAGVADSKSIFDYEEKDYDRIMDINLKAVFLMSKAVIEQMKLNNGGVILNTSSMVSIYGQPSGCAYPISKFGVNGLTKSLARELGKYHIRVNAVAPGVIHTDMVDALPEEIINNILKEIPLGKMGEPEDIANAFAFLASDDASFISGSILSVDGAGMN